MFATLCRAAGAFFFQNKDAPFQKRRVFFQKKKEPAASLKRSKHGLGLPIHIKMLLILINIGLLTIIIN